MMSSKKGSVSLLIFTIFVVFVKMVQGRIGEGLVKFVIFGAVCISGHKWQKELEFI